MSAYFNEFRETTNRTVYKKILPHAIQEKHCVYCAFHRCDNAFASRRPRSDRYKNQRRA